MLPFVNMSGEADNEYFSDGISEEILNVLAGAGELQVAARTSSFSFKGKDVEVPEIAKALNVRMVLEGSVRRQGEKVRITAQLIDARNGFHVWSQTYDRDLQDIFAIQDEIAKAIGAELKVKIGGGAGDRHPAAAPATWPRTTCTCGACSTSTCGAGTTCGRPYRCSNRRRPPIRLSRRPGPGRRWSIRSCRPTPTGSAGRSPTGSFWTGDCTR
ncbi:hypothetical protein [Arenimonas daejeonensis]|uniref:hypothetical protein n=1 Tax=Arenimonas daejeonensis TaxID=370777 RepID=UPI0013159680|nr:hypothetical protein [Arenimonas daejeonensis]